MIAIDDIRAIAWKISQEFETLADYYQAHSEEIKGVKRIYKRSRKVN